jgi:hypothetical protein
VAAINNSGAGLVLGQVLWMVVWMRKNGDVALLMLVVVGSGHVLY